MKRVTLSAFLCILALIPIRLLASEGMWLPILINGYVEGEMKSMGMRISAEDIYSINNGSLKDAIFIFGGGCTSEIISSQGLLLTNHHCGYSQIQSHSSLEHDYLKNGFWASTLQDELPNKGLTATRIVRIENVTTAVFAGAKKPDGSIDNEVLQNNIRLLVSNATGGTHYEASVKPFYYGNEYYMFVTETFKDVRLVGTPPSSIGKYGGDTDNWMWPRHTGDFSVFRIYAGKDNKPAEYAAGNVPYKPYKHLSVSLKGIKEGDFTLVYGFPGRTQEYLPSAAVELVVDVQNPIRIRIREAALAVIDKAMASGDALRIMYAAKQSRISNYYKKWIGESKGLARLNAVERKKRLEDLFVQRSGGNYDYQSLPKKFKELYAAYTPYAAAVEYFNELLSSGPEILRYSYGYQKIADGYKDMEAKGELDKAVSGLRSGADGYFKNYDLETDKKLFMAVVPIVYDGLEERYRPAILTELYKKYKGSWQQITDDIYSRSTFASKEKVGHLLDKMSAKNTAKIKEDPAYALAASIYDTYSTMLAPSVSQYNNTINEMMSVWMKAQMDVLPTEKKYYADANSTLRVTFGRVEGSQPRDGVKYTPFTTIDGVMEKYIPGDTEFDLSPKFLELYKKRDFGRYGSDGSLVVAFTASNHTTGGNSGSPVLNADGHLIGINFDRSWESTMSDIMYDPERCRNISCDIRYVLWVIEKVGGAERLIREMTLVE